MTRLNLGKELVDLIHPVGSTVFNKNADFDPNELWIGTVWENLGCCVLMGCDPNDSNYNNPGIYVGENEHILTRSELPAEQLSVWGAGNPNGNDILRFGSVGVSTLETGSRIGLTEALGLGQAHNNVQRSFLGYWWIRTS